MITVILVKPETAGNVGAVARVMANFDLTKLVLVNPQCDHLSQEARNRAKHAQEILQKAIVTRRIPRMDYLVATTAIAGTTFNPRSPLTPSQLAQKMPIKGNIGLLIGPEGDGLSIKDILRADFVVTIPSSKKYPTLNISHACAILFYELFNKAGNIHEVASGKEKEILFGYIKKTIAKMKFPTKEKKETQYIVWKRLLGKSFLTKREAFVLMGYFKKLR